MRRNAIRVVLVLVLAIGGAQVLRARSAHAATAVTINGAASCSGTTFCYAPATATIAGGDTVTWTNQSGVQHTVTRCDASACSGTDGGNGTDPAFDLAVAAANGSTASQKFNGAGTYNYYCKIHGFSVMHGTITVQASGATTTTAVTGPSPTSTMGPANPPPAAAVAAEPHFTG